MLGYYKKHVVELAKRVHRIHDNNDDLDLLIETQLYLLKRIVITEAKKSEYKAAFADMKARLRRERLEKEAARSLKVRMRRVRTRIDQCQWLLYIWRCFGDGIAFSYLDKWAIKPFLYHTDSAEIRESAGHITAKEGLTREFALVLDAKNHGIPALLTDLTTTIRHGDVCLLGTSDPHVIEVKSSSNVNPRTSRQHESINAIHSYLENDEAQNVRGAPYLKRVELMSPEVNYCDAINQAIVAAIQNGYTKCSPEPCIHYIAMSTHCKPDYRSLFAGIEKPMVFSLNEAKNQQDWACYYPFTLSIKTPELLYAFLKGDLYVLVVFDLAQLAQLAQQKGFSMSVLEDPNWTYEFQEVRPEDGSEPMTWRLSRHFVLRVALEFLSWEWVLSDQQQKMRLYKELASKGVAESSSFGYPS